MRYLVRVVVAVAAAGCCLVGSASALASVTPGWECVPTTAGQPVTSGGTGASPSCPENPQSGFTTPVLAPTYVSSGVGGKPTVEFAQINVQILNSTESITDGGSTASTNGEGNLVIGYDENSGTQTGSHNLILGTGQSSTSYGAIVGGSDNTANAPYNTVFGQHNTVQNSGASVLGGRWGSAWGTDSSVTGGYLNTANNSFASVTGGCSNRAGSGTNTVNSNCTAAANAGDWPSVSGGIGNQANAQGASIAGGKNELETTDFNSKIGSMNFAP